VIHPWGVVNLKRGAEAGLWGIVIGMEFRPRLVEKRWDHSREELLISKWEEEGLFETRIGDGRVLVIDTPPPIHRVGPTLVAWPTMRRST
jgi:hypothetical protein